MAAIRVMITDDSAIIRRLIRDVIEGEPDLEVVGVAENGRIALERIPELRPDVVTLDIEMPEMNGLETLDAIRKLRPRLPVIMFSTLTESGAEITLEALSRGASDFVTKPSGPGGLGRANSQIREQLVPKIRALTTLRKAVRPAPPGRADRPSSGPGPTAPTSPPSTVECVVLGISTGGPRALERVIPKIPADLPVPILAVQHMPKTFTRLLAERLDRVSALTVVEAEEGMTVEAGRMYLSPGEHHLEVRRLGTSTRLALTDAPPEHSCRPSADVLFRSAVKVYGSHLLGVVMTGMGEDGSGGAREICAAGGRVIIQDEESSVVWGMPGAVARLGLADREFPLDQIASEVTRRVRGRSHVAQGPVDRVRNAAPGTRP